MSVIQQQLFDINQRYDLLGTKLADRHSELSNTIQNVKQYLEDVQDIMVWLDEKEAVANIQHLPVKEEEARHKLKEFKVIQDQLMNMF